MNFQHGEGSLGQAVHKAVTVQVPRTSAGLDDTDGRQSPCGCGHRKGQELERSRDRWAPALPSAAVPALGGPAPGGRAPTGPDIRPDLSLTGSRFRVGNGRIPEGQMVRGCYSSPSSLNFPAAALSRSPISGRRREARGLPPISPWTPVWLFPQSVHEEGAQPRSRGQ